MQYLKRGKPEADRAEDDAATRTTVEAALVPDGRVGAYVNAGCKRRAGAAP